jgi:Holliday junction resolvasome RuvABC DNA-binding subunit
VVDALVRMGFKPLEAERAVGEFKGREGEPMESLVRDALRALMP